MIEKGFIIGTKEDLITELTKIINKKLTDIKFKEKLNREFLKKGFQASTTNSIINGEKSIAELSDYELIAVCKACEINEKKYFGENILKSYGSYVPNDKKEYNSITFKNMIKINDEEYIGPISYREIYEAMSRNRLYYNLNFQRAPKLVKVGKEYIKIPDIDTDATGRIEATALKGKLESSMGVLGIILTDENKKPDMVEEKNGNLYNITCYEKPAILDFMHRIIGVTNATLINLSDNNEYLEGNMILKFVIATPERCKEIVYQSFLKSQTDKNYLKAIDQNDYSNFLDRVINNSKSLKNKVTTTFEETKVNNKVLTYIPILIDVVKNMDIDFSNKSKVMFKSREIAENLDIIYEMLEETKIYHNSPNLWVSILNQAYLLTLKKEQYDDILFEYIEKLSRGSIDEKLIKKLKINNKIFNIRDIINEFEVN